MLYERVHPKKMQKAQQFQAQCYEREITLKKEQTFKCLVLYIDSPVGFL